MNLEIIRQDRAKKLETKIRDPLVVGRRLLARGKREILETASPAFVNQAHGQGTGFETSFTATEPAGAASGQGFVAMLTLAAGFTGLTAFTGWTQLYSINCTDFTAFFYYIQRGASAPNLTASWTNNAYYEWMIANYSGVVGASFIDASAAGTPATGGNPDPPAITTTTPNTTVLALGWTWDAWATGGATPPSGYTLRFGLLDWSLGISDLAVASAGAQNPGAYANVNAGTGGQVGVTVALASQGAGTAQHDAIFFAMPSG